MIRTRGTWALSGLIATLLALNSVVWGAWPEGIFRGLRFDSTFGCGSSSGCVESIDRSQSFEFHFDDLNESYDCSNCVFTSQSKQHWCRLRQQTEETCSHPWFPWNNNYAYYRWMTFYSCPGNVVAVYCDPWVYDGCCNSGDSNPPACADCAYPECLTLPGTEAM
jgi:hypothetical protein